MSGRKSKNVSKVKISLSDSKSSLNGSLSSSLSSSKYDLEAMFPMTPSYKELRQKAYLDKSRNSSSSSLSKNDSQTSSGQSSPEKKIFKKPLPRPTSCVNVSLKMLEASFDTSGDSAKKLLGHVKTAKKSINISNLSLENSLNESVLHNKISKKTKGKVSTLFDFSISDSLNETAEQIIFKKKPTSQRKSIHLHFSPENSISESLNEVEDKYVTSGLVEGIIKTPESVNVPPDKHMNSILYVENAGITSDVSTIINECNKTDTTKTAAIETNDGKSLKDNNNCLDLLSVNNVNNFIGTDIEVKSDARNVSVNPENVEEPDTEISIIKHKETGHEGISEKLSHNNFEVQSNTSEYIGEAIESLPKTTDQDVLKKPTGCFKLTNINDCSIEASINSSQDHLVLGLKKSLMKNRRSVRLSNISFLMSSMGAIPETKADEEITENLQVENKQSSISQVIINRSVLLPEDVIRSNESHSEFAEMRTIPNVTSECLDPLPIHVDVISSSQNDVLRKSSLTSEVSDINYSSLESLENVGQSNCTYIGSSEEKMSDHKSKLLSDCNLEKPETGEKPHTKQNIVKHDTHCPIEVVGTSNMIYGESSDKHILTPQNSVCLESVDPQNKSETPNPKEEETERFDLPGSDKEDGELVESFCSNHEEKSFQTVDTNVCHVYKLGNKCAPMNISECMEELIESQPDYCSEVSSSQTNLINEIILKIPTTSKPSEINNSFFQNITKSLESSQVEDQLVNGLRKSVKQKRKSVKVNDITLLLNKVPEIENNSDLLNMPKQYEGPLSHNCDDKNTGSVKNVSASENCSDSDAEEKQEVFDMTKKIEGTSTSQPELVQEDIHTQNNLTNQDILKSRLAELHNSSFDSTEDFGECMVVNKEVEKSMHPNPDHKHIEDISEPNDETVETQPEASQVISSQNDSNNQAILRKPAVSSKLDKFNKLSLEESFESSQVVNVIVDKLKKYVKQKRKSVRVSDLTLLANTIPDSSHCVISSQENEPESTELKNVAEEDFCAEEKEDIEYMVSNKEFILSDSQEKEKTLNLSGQIETTVDTKETTVDTQSDNFKEATLPANYLIEDPVIKKPSTSSKMTEINPSVLQNIEDSLVSSQVENELENGLRKSIQPTRKSVRINELPYLKSNEAIKPGCETSNVTPQELSSELQNSFKTNEVCGKIIVEARKDNEDEVLTEKSIIPDSQTTLNVFVDFKETLAAQPEDLCPEAIDVIRGEVLENPTAIDLNKLNNSFENNKKLLKSPEPENYQVEELRESPRLKNRKISDVTFIVSNKKSLSSIGATQHDGKNGEAQKLDEQNSRLPDIENPCERQSEKSSIAKNQAPFISSIPRYVGNKAKPKQSRVSLQCDSINANLCKVSGKTRSASISDLTFIISKKEKKETEFDEASKIDASKSLLPQCTDTVMDTQKLVMETENKKKTSSCVQLENSSLNVTNSESHCSELSEHVQETSGIESKNNKIVSPQGNVFVLNQLSKQPNVSEMEDSYFETIEKTFETSLPQGDFINQMRRNIQKKKSLKFSDISFSTSSEEVALEPVMRTTAIKDKKNKSTELTSKIDEVHNLGHKIVSGPGTSEEEEKKSFNASLETVVPNVHDSKSNYLNSCKNADEVIGSQPENSVVISSQDELFCGKVINHPFSTLKQISSKDATVTYINTEELKEVLPTEIMTCDEAVNCKNDNLAGIETNCQEENGTKRLEDNICIPDSNMADSAVSKITETESAAVNLPGNSDKPVKRQPDNDQNETLAGIGTKLNGEYVAIEDEKPVDNICNTTTGNRTSSICKITEAISATSNSPEHLDQPFENQLVEKVPSSTQNCKSNVIEVDSEKCIRNRSIILNTTKSKSFEPLSEVITSTETKVCEAEIQEDDTWKTKVNDKIPNKSPCSIEVKCSIPNTTENDDKPCKSPLEKDTNIGLANIQTQLDEDYILGDNVEYVEDGNKVHNSSQKFDLASSSDAPEHVAEPIRSVAPFSKKVISNNGSITSNACIPHVKNQGKSDQSSKEVIASQNIITGVTNHINLEDDEPSKNSFKIPKCSQVTLMPSPKSFVGKSVGDFDNLSVKEQNLNWSIDVSVIQPEVKSRYKLRSQSTPLPKTRVMAKFDENNQPTPKPAIVKPHNNLSKQPDKKKPKKSVTFDISTPADKSSVHGDPPPDSLIDISEIPGVNLKQNNRAQSATSSPYSFSKEEKRQPSKVSSRSSTSFSESKRAAKKSISVQVTREYISSSSSGRWSQSKDTELSDSKKHSSRDKSLNNKETNSESRKHSSRDKSLNYEETNSETLFENVNRGKSFESTSRKGSDDISVKRKSSRISDLHNSNKSYILNENNLDDSTLSLHPPKKPKIGNSLRDRSKDAVSFLDNDHNEVPSRRKERALTSITNTESSRSPRLRGGNSINDESVIFPPKKKVKLAGSSRNNSVKSISQGQSSPYTNRSNYGSSQFDDSLPLGYSVSDSEESFNFNSFLNENSWIRPFFKCKNREKSDTALSELSPSRISELSEDLMPPPKSKKVTKLAKPASWANQKFYKYLFNFFKPRYGIEYRKRSEEFVLFLHPYVESVVLLKDKKDYAPLVLTVKEKTKEIGLCSSIWDYKSMCDHLPYEFKAKSYYCGTKLYEPVIDHLAPF